LKVGLSKNIENDNVCPNINFDTENGIKLDLDEECSWDFENRTRNDGIKILTLTIFGRKVMLFTTTFMMNVSLTAPQKSVITLANSLEW